MTRRKAIADLVGAVAALLIAIWFVHAYSHFVGLRIELEVDTPSLPPACEMLRDYSLFTLVLPLLVAVLGIIMIVTKMDTGMSIVCQSGWLLALTLICLAIVAWEVPFIPIF